MAQLGDFSRSAALGFQAGKDQAVPSAMNLLVKGMLAEKDTLLKRKFELEKQKQKFGQDVALSGAKEKFKSIFGGPQVSDVAKEKRRIWNQASKDANTELGGSMFIGIGKQSKKFISLRKKRFLEGLKRAGITETSEPKSVIESLTDETDEDEDVINKSNIGDINWSQ